MRNLNCLSANRSWLFWNGNSEMKKLSIVVPVYNEERQLGEVIQVLMNSPCPIDREWIFVDDKSRDGSLAILESLASRYGFKVIAQPTNQGKGAAVIRGFEAATGDFIMIQDADSEYDPNDVPLLLQPLLDGRADVVYGSRFKKSGWQVHRTYHYFINRFLTVLSNLFSGLYLTDMETCYKIFRSDLLKAMRLKSRRFGIEVELTAYVAKIRARVFELPISYFPRTVLQGKKISWKDGAAALFHLVRFNMFTSLEKAFSGLPDRYRP
ncbi:MAG: glycosyl transferase [Bdellovibrionales bacterium RIFOXYC1_FULL_54_43]|nr:MAG: glycosyl transferase [Bdellovibrionales bacterium RIFOXYC1_FULL_54_43]OFZ85175.1 MAG: glycosyl transferase [Bdellovibrionales bacterium RIFOXYD1_FULL_55_31]